MVPSTAPHTEMRASATESLSATSSTPSIICTASAAIHSPSRDGRASSSSTKCKAEDQAHTPKSAWHCIKSSLRTNLTAKGAPEPTFNNKEPPSNEERHNHHWWFDSWPSSAATIRLFGRARSNTASTATTTTAANGYRLPYHHAASTPATSISAHSEQSIKCCNSLVPNFGYLDQSSYALHEHIEERPAMRGVLEAGNDGNGVRLVWVTKRQMPIKKMTPVWQAPEPKQVGSLHEAVERAAAVVKSCGGEFAGPGNSLAGDRRKCWFGD